MARVEYLQFLQGANTQVSPFLMGDDMLLVQDNVVTTYKLGALLKRPGYSQIGGTSGTEMVNAKPILGLYNFRQSAAVQKMLATCNSADGDDTELFYLNDSDQWIEIAAAQVEWEDFANINVEMETFLHSCIFVGYGATDGFLPVGSLNGTTFSTSTNVTNMPQGKFIKRYRDRIYVANLSDSGLYPYRVGFSDVPSGGSIGWTEYQADTGLFDVDYGEEITGLGSNWDRLVIFTEYSAYLYNQSSKKNSWDVGCSNHRTIKNSGAYMLWANQDGVFQSTGGRPQNIAGRVMDFIKGSTPSDYFAEVVDEEYHLHIGSATVNGISYSNCTLVYNIPTQTWRWHEYFDGMETFAKYSDSGENRFYMGTTDGEVMNLGKYTDSEATRPNSDDGNDIQAMFRTKPFNFGVSSDYKRLIKMYAYADKAQGLQLKAKTINRNNSNLIKPKPLGQLNKYINEFTPKVEQGEFLQIEGVETGQNPYFSCYGFALDIDKSTTKR